MVLNKEEIYKLRLEGKKIKEIAALFGVTGEAIRISIKRNFPDYIHPIKSLEYICEKCGKIFKRTKPNKSGKYFCSIKCKPVLTKEYFAKRDKIRRRKYYQTEKGKEIIKKLNRINYLKNKEKSRARTTLNMAVKLGKIIKPNKCSMCGVENVRIEGHHKDYKKRLDVIWLCTPCHNNIHHL